VIDYLFIMPQFPLVVKLFVIASSSSSSAGAGAAAGRRGSSRRSGRSRGAGEAGGVEGGSSPGTVCTTLGKFSAWQLYTGNYDVG
jgi:hypothetical protein